jgi:tetratricopeptide (TPR) repeat protein
MRTFPVLVSICAVLTTLALTACGAATVGAGTMLGSVEVPDRITDDTYAELSRVYVSLPLDDSSRALLRQRLVEYLDRRTAAILDEGDYNAVVGQFSAITELYSPEDFAQARLPREMEPLARHLVTHGSPRGDEGRVLSALLALHALHPQDGFDRRYQVLERWGREARETLPGPIEQYSGLIDVWEEHARLTPTPPVLRRLARLHIERRNGMLRLLQEEGPRLAANPAMRVLPSLLRRAPLDVASVYLRHGDLASAVSSVEAMGDGGGLEVALLRVLGDARDGDDDALIELAQAYSEGRPDVTLGLCHYGRRRNLEDARFPVCLARVHAGAGEYPRATGWYAEAIHLAPTDREVYDEALDALGAFIARGIYDSDPSEARGLARAAELILRERTQRWPDTPPSVSPEQLHYVVGLLEMNAGNAEEARRRFQASVDAKETPDAQLELGRLAEGTGRAADAVRHYRRALDLTAGDSAEILRGRARILELLASAYRKSDNAEQAERMTRQSVQLWDQLLAGATGPVAAEAHLRRGVLLDRLGRREDALEGFRAAMAAAPDRREIYAAILSHLVVTAPAPEFANEVFTEAMRELSLEPEWKVYFALWVDTIAARAGAGAAGDAHATLQSHSNGDEWHGRLARFGVGALPYTDLLGEASNVGQRTEAYFYEGARRLRSGDPDGARQQFQRVIDTHLVNFYEYTMALELLSQTSAQ